MKNSIVVCSIVVWSLATCVVAAGCFSYENSSATDTGQAEDPDVGGEDLVADTGADQGTSDTVADVAPDIPALPEVPACADVTAEELTYTPRGCGYEVSHPRGINDILSSCGGAGASGSTPSAIHLTFPSERAEADVAVTWTTADTTRLSEVELGDAEDALDRLFRGHSFTYAGLDGRLVHEVHLCGLEPSRTYYYRVGGEGAWSDVFTFTTAPPSDSAERFTFAVTGDTRNDTNEPWAQAAEAIHQAGAEFLLFTGDAVDLGTVQAQWDSWFAAGTPFMAEIPYVPANGNHDLFTINYSGQFALPRGEDNFYIRYGNTVIISLNDFPIQDPRSIAGSTADFLDATLAEHADATWKIVINHRPFFSASTRHGSSEDLQAEWMPILDRHEVDMVFNGHDHNYERSRPIRNEEVVAMGRGTIYVVAAGVGAPLYDNGSQWWTHTSERVSSYVIVDVDGDELRFTAYRLDGTVLDEFVWAK